MLSRCHGLPVESTRWSGVEDAPEETHLPAALCLLEWESAAHGGKYTCLPDVG